MSEIAAVLAAIERLQSSTDMDCISPFPPHTAAALLSALEALVKEKAAWESETETGEYVELAAVAEARLADFVAAVGAESGD